MNFTTTEKMSKTPFCNLIEHLNERIYRLDKMEEFVEDKMSVAMEKLALTEVLNKCIPLLSEERFWIIHSRVNGMHNAHHIDVGIEDSEGWYEDMFGESMDELFVSLTHGESEEKV